jgi:hypothetical protein
MDRRLLRYYNRELLHIRDAALEFAQEYPKIAGRLGLDTTKADECADPYVERLLEGFSSRGSRRACWKPSTRTTSRRRRRWRSCGFSRTSRREAWPRA